MFPVRAPLRGRGQGRRNLLAHPAAASHPVTLAKRTDFSVVGEIYRDEAAEGVVPAAGIGGDGAENAAMSEYKTNPRVSWAICWPLRASGML